MTATMLVTTFGVAVVSALCPLVNLELYMAGAGVLNRAGGLWGLVVVAAFGQALGKLFWYQMGRSARHLGFIRKKTESPRWKNQFEKLKRQTEERPFLGTLMVLASATLGLPPLAIMAVLSGQLHFSRVLFVITTFVGRSMRFAVLVGGVSWFARLV